jgi:hypothetical protein
MRDIRPALPPDLTRHFGDPPDITHQPPFPVDTYRQLIEHVARLSYSNKDHLLFFRGQSRDFTGKGGGSTLYPSIYRGARVLREEVREKFELLEIRGRALHRLFAKSGLDGHADLGRRKTIQWAVLQHYRVCDTPLLDFTQSLRVACSFAQEETSADHALIFVVGFPHIANRITVNSEHDLIIVRLLSICPPAALRPYFQEGFLAGTADITTEYDPKTELDFNRRLIAKFAIPTSSEFWGPGLTKMPRTELYPDHDEVEELCGRLHQVAASGPQPSVSEFLAEWIALERLLLAEAQRRQDRVPTLRHAADLLISDGLLEPWLATRLDSLRRFRNELVHRTPDLATPDLATAIAEITQLRTSLQANIKRAGRRST